MVNNEKYFREYKIKVYLNARHFIYINGNQGETHPHTWEFVLYMKFNKQNFIEFTEFEKVINAYIEKYQNRIINELEPFDTLIPTLENITDCFSKDLFKIIQDMNGLLIRIEASETPTRSYVVDINDDFTYEEKINSFYEESVDEIIDNTINLAIDII